MLFLIRLIDRISIAPRERALGRPLTRVERLGVALRWLSPLIAFVVYALVRNAVNGTLHW